MFHRRIAESIANKQKEQNSKVLSYIGTRISFTRLKSILVSIHRVRLLNVVRPCCLEIQTVA